LPVISLLLTVGCVQIKDGSRDSERGVEIQREALDAAVETRPAPDVAVAREVSPSGDLVPEVKKGGHAAPDCTPDCLLRTCGPDGCTATCGECGALEECRGGRCVTAGCVPGCEERECGDDGCGSLTSCGRCPQPDRCDGGVCRARIGVGLFGGRPGTPGDGIPRAVENLYMGFPAAWSGPCDYASFPVEKADRILARNPAGAILLTLLPECGFGPFTADFSVGSKPYEAVKKLAEAVAAFDAAVIVRIAPHMNAPWFPWGPCALDNNGKTCLDDATRYREGFANAARLLKALGGPRLRMAWTPLAEPAYWREHLAEYPTYEDFYPGDDVVDYVGLDLSWTGAETPPEGAFAAGLESFYRAWAAPEGRGKPMIVAETTAECRLTEKTACVGPVAGIEGTEGWWGPWGRLGLEAAEGGAPEDCAEVPTGEEHLVIAPTPGDDGDLRCGGYYVGGLARPLNWGEGVDLSGGNALRLRARKDPSGAAPVLQLEVCDTSAPACTGEDRCCPAESLTTTITVDSIEWRTWTLPFEDFSPSRPGADPAMDWAHVRALKLHVLCPDQRGPVAPLHLDGVGVARITRPGEEACAERRRAWARQVYAPDLCTRFPNLDLVLWRQGLRRTPDAVFDGRIRDAGFWRELWSGECFTGTWSTIP